MYKNTLVLLLICFGFALNAQETWVYFTDKPFAKEAILNADVALSERSIDRRIRQGIWFDEKDVAVSSDYIRQLKSLGFEVQMQSRWMNAVVIKNSASLPLLDGLPFVQKYAPVKKLDVFLADHTAKTSMLNYGASTTQIQLVNGDHLHALGFTGSGMWIAVLDAGFIGADTQLSFDSLISGPRFKDSRNFVIPANTVFQSGGTHGTAVLSTMAANSPGVFVGTAPHADYSLYSTEDIGSERRVEEYNWLAAAERADSVGADVINSSLGYYDFDIDSEDYSFAQMDGNTTVVTRAADWAASRGIVVVVSAGNAGSSAWGRIAAPSDGDSVLAIGGTNMVGSYVAFSSRGPSADGRVKPDVSAVAADAQVIQTGDQVIASNGTSFSSPQIAGLAACLWQKYPNLNSEEISNAIRRSAHQFANPDSLMGYGIPNFGTADVILSNNEYQLIQGVRLYPNPVLNRILTIERKEITTANVFIYNLNGQSVFSKEIMGSKQSLELPSGLARGTYVLHLLEGKKVFRSKLIIQ